MDPTLVSAVLSNEDQQTILAALNTVFQKMPFLIDLSIANRMSMAKLGDKSEAFVRKALELANQHDTMFPVSFRDEMQKDSDILDSIAPIRVAVAALHKKIDDTTMQAGAEFFAAARTVYSVTKTPFGNAVMRDAASDLGKRYGRSRQARAEAAARASAVHSAQPSTQPASQPAPTPHGV
jgi:hypothetical protein